MKQLIVLICSLTSTMVSHAQNGIIGSWKGSAAVMGQQMKAVFHLKEVNGQLSATFDSPDQSAFDLECGKVSLVNDSLFIEVKSIHGTYIGKWDGKDKIVGRLQQGMARFQLDLERTTQTAAPKPKPQTPQPPFNYVIEEVGYENTKQQVHLAGTFTKPNGNGKFPVVLMITGSGPQDRDETIGQHKPFWVIADRLAKQGIAVLRVDDRGTGKSTGDFSTASSEDFATDVMAGIDYLKSRPDIDTKHIGLIGHSEGGMIAPYVAARSKDIAFIVSLAGPAAGGQAANDFQNMLPLQKAGIPQVHIDSFLILHHALVNAAVNSSQDQDFKTAIGHVFQDWKKRQSPSTLQTLIKGADEQVIASFYGSYGAFRNSWWHFFMTYKPWADIAKLRCAVLALNGEKDEQVESSTNLAAFESALKKSRSKQYKTMEVVGVNHLFQHCKQCGSIKEYLSLEETFDEATLATIVNWIKEVTK